MLQAPFTPDPSLTPRPPAIEVASGPGVRQWPSTIPHPPRTGRGGIPAILTTLAERLDRYFHAPAEWLPGLNAANGSRRQQRSERRIACVQLLRASLKFCDLVSLRVGVPQADGSWLNLTLPYLAEQAGLDLRRAERALRDLQAAALVRVRPQCERIETAEGDRFKGLAAFKYLPVSLFDAFGLRARLVHERTRAHLRAQRKAAAAHKRERRDNQAADLLRRLAASRAGSAERVAAGQQATRQRDRTADFERMLMLRAGHLKSQHPEWDRETCYAQARQQLAPPDPL